MPQPDLTQHFPEQTSPQNPPSPEGTGTRFEHPIVLDNVAYLQGELRATWGELLAFLGTDLDEQQQREFDQLCHEHFQRIVTLMRRRMFGNVVPFEEEQVVQTLMGNIRADLDANPGRAVVILDRAIHHAVRQQIGEEYQDRVGYLSITRQAGHLFTASTGGKVARVGDAPLGAQAQALAERMEGKEVALVDDTFVEGGTTRAARRTLASAGVKLAPEEADRFFFRAVRDPSKPWSDAQAHVLATRSIASAEAREFSSTGGSHNGAGRRNRVGFQVAPMAPFDETAHALRLKGRLDIDSISDEILAIEIEYLERFQRIVGREITLFDVRRTLPSDPPDQSGRRRLPAEYMERNFLGEGEHPQAEYAQRFIAFLRQTKLTDYLQFARQKLAEKERREKQVVCVDMDGVIGKLRYTSNALGINRFHNSRLGESVRANAVRLAREVNGFTSDEEAAAYLDSLDTEVGLPGYFIGEHGQQLEERHGEHAVARIREIFSQAYEGHPDVAAREADRYLASMPLAYHAYRVCTWDHDMDDVYEDNEAAREFAVQVTERGGRLVFVTAAPRIHAVKMLQKFGIIQALGPDGFDLYTVEDLYDPEKLAQGQYVERDKSAIMQRVGAEKGVDASRIAMGGDQYRSDVHAPVAAGVESALIEGPEDLARFASMMRLPRDQRGARVPGDGAESVPAGALSREQMLHGRTGGNGNGQHGKTVRQEIAVQDSL